MLGLRRASLTTKVGRRTLATFVACAIAPITALSIVAYREVRGTLIQESQARLDEAAKRHAQQTVERSAWLLEFLAEDARGAPRRNEASDEARRFTTIWTELLDSVRSQTLLTDAQRAHLAGGRGIIVVTPTAPLRVRFGVPARVRGSEAIVWGAPDPRFLWGFSENEEMSPTICVLDGSGAPLTCSANPPSLDGLNGVDARTGPDARATLTSTRTVFLRRDFATRDWTVVALEGRDAALAPVAGFGRTFALVAGLALLIVFFLSHVQIRRTTAPLESLLAATERVTGGDFDTRVPIQSDDEFGVLAKSFSAMSREIGRQFGVLRGLDEVDRVALEGGDVRKLWSAARPRVGVAVPSARQVFVVPESDAACASWWGACTYGDDSRRSRTLAAIESRSIDRLCLASTPTMHAVSAAAVADIGGDDALRWKWSALPLWHAGRLQGALLLGKEKPFDKAGRHVDDARRLADRLAIALSNLHLVRRLDALNFGTMTAFARAIDANSSWTAGHSERVCEVAITLGRALDLGPTELDTLQRGSLLHDIGKIGIPPSILDKPGRLDPEEMKVVQSHPLLGVSILEPIGAFGDILPLVRNHHERLDGRGYPHGIRGMHIDLLTRVLSIADVYDALVSSRPYRPGMLPDAALALMREGADTQFDRHLLNIFIELHGLGEISRVYNDPAHQEAAAGLALAVAAGRDFAKEAV